MIIINANIFLKKNRKTMDLMSHIKVPIAANCKDVCLQNTSKSHSYHLKILKLL